MEQSLCNKALTRGIIEIHSLCFTAVAQDSPILDAKRHSGPFIDLNRGLRLVPLM